jgi:hypothetical protein
MFVQTVEENQQSFTPRQILQAKQARELYEIIERPSYNYFLAIVKNKLLLHTKITPRDILHAKAIFGKDLGSLQGKVTRKYSNPVVIDYIHVPKDIMEYHRNLTLALVIMHIGGLLFLIRTFRDIQITAVEKLNQKHHHYLQKV